MLTGHILFLNVMLLEKLHKPVLLLEGLGKPAQNLLI